MMTYSLTLRIPCVSMEGEEDFYEEYYQLTAKTDGSARKQAKAIVKQMTTKEKQGAQIFLCFYRQSDGCKGTISL